MKTTLKLSSLFLILLCLSCRGSRQITDTQTQRSTVSGVTYKGGDGSTMEKAVVIIARNSSQGIPAEYDYISQIHGRRGVDWIFVQQALAHEGSKSYDIITIRLPGSSKEINYYFDITSFFGKF